MPIAQCFDPATGASGGSKSSGSADSWVPIGDLGGWTLEGTLTNLNDYVFTGGKHFFDLVGGAATVDWALNAGANFTGPRFHTPLLDGNGQPVLAGDKFILAVRITELDVGASRQWAAAIGTCIDGAATVTNTLRPSAISAGATGVGTPNGGAFIDNFANTASVASGTNVLGDILYGGAPTRYVVGASVQILSASAGALNQRLGGAVQGASAATPMRLMVALTTLGAVISTSGELSLKAEYRVVRFQ
jgi:hypothetical protein